MFSMEISGLIERCKQGDTEAFGELYKAYAGKMKRVCLRYVANREEADDVMHDAFVIIFTSFSRLRDASKAESWMMTIARNVALKHVEHQNALTMASLEEAEALPEERGEVSVSGIPFEEIMQLVERLPEGYAKVFRLSVFEGLSHKEIANMLGIEPHSSSSQLARAKKMLRNMILQYWTVMLLLLLIPVIFCYLRKENIVATKDEKPVVAEHKEEKGEQPTTRYPLIENAPVTTLLPVYRATIIHLDTLSNAIAQNVAFATNDSLENLITHEQIFEDATAKDTTIRSTHLPHNGMADLRPDKPFANKSQQQKWSVDVAYSGGYAEQITHCPFGFTETPLLSPTGEATSPVTFRNWSDYAAFLSEIPDELASPIQNIIKEIALNNANQPADDEIVRMSHHQMPFTWSLTIGCKLTDCFGLETGLNYSRLTSDFETGTDGNVIHEQQAIHYLGIPLKGIYSIYNKTAWNIYGSVGLTAEVPVYAPLNTSYYLHGVMEATEKTTIHAPWQWSVGTGLGLQYNLTPSIGLFTEPCLQYYIPTECSVETYFTEHPLSFSLPLGVRFTW